MMESDEIDDWRDRRAKPMRRLTRSTFDNSEMDEEIKVLASLLPDEILYNCDDYSKRSYDCCLLAGDVSGFTELCERYNKGKGGSSRLSHVLNNYIGAMVQEIMSHGGDILKFSGDAFVVVWKKTSNLPMRDAVHEAIDCGLILQKTYGTYMTDVGVIIRAGTATFSLIGDDSNAHYLNVGQPIWDLKAADGKSGPGDVVVCPSAWQHINPNEYLFKYLDDELHVKVTGIGPNWRVIPRNIQKTDKGKSGESEAVAEDYSLRPAVNWAVNNGIYEKLRKFIIKPVMNALDLNEPLDYLTEVRMISIVFINVVISHELSPSVFIEVANETYKIVCNVVADYNGSMNKINVFDKDLMMLVIFGLRGYKLDSECEIALNCATQCHKRIGELEAVNGVAIGVTTGRTYCGVFGHTLRKEYTVISIIVNMAARLMMAYPSKVTCSREVMLQSQLDPKHFILQEYKPLKGISHPGPIYQYVLIEMTHKCTESVNRYPLLGRDEEVELYMNMVEKAVYYSKFNPRKIQEKFHFSMLVIQGAAQLGKRRLLDELLYVTPNSMPVVRIPLLKSDTRVPYSAIRLIFNGALDLQENATKAERQKRIYHRMKYLQNKNLLCSLNEIFNVQFETNNEYLQYTDNQKKLLVFKMVKQLAYHVMGIFWIVAFYSLENIDPESWPFLNLLLELNTLFVVSTLSAEEEFNHKFGAKAKIIELRSLKKMYHAPISCHIMNVEALTPELEKIIQLRSGGKPGWIENFLISLLQAGEVIIKNLKVKEAYDSGLIMPPTYLLKRMKKTDKEKTFLIFDKSKKSNFLRWNMYIECYRESFKNLTEIEKTEKYFKDEKVISAAIINPDFAYEDLMVTFTLDVFTIKTFDSLTSYEQLVVKCSSVLSTNFPRDILLYIMNTNATRKTAIAIKTLFENRVLSCARGDFMDGNNMMLFKGRMLYPEPEISIKCDCKGIIIADCCFDLPKYASCGYLRFRLNKFREIIYNLLTDSQKREFHTRAVKYLEKETRRCKSCGSGYFVRILGTYYKDEFRKKKKTKTRSSMQVSESRNMETSNRLNMKKQMEKDSTSRSSGAESTYTKVKSRTTQSSMYSVGMPTQGSEHDNGCCGYAIIRKLRKDTGLTRTFSNSDFSECQCKIILINMYSELIDHCKGADLTEKLFDCMVAFVYVCIDGNNIPEALRVLHEAEEVLKEPPFTDKYLDWMLDLRRGKLFTLYGFAKLTTGLYDEAYGLFLNALDFYGFSFPTSMYTIRFQNFQHTTKHFMRFYIFPDCFQGNDDGDATFCDNLSECLCFLSRIFMYKKEWAKAELAASWSLNKAIDSQTDFMKLCRSYANMIMVCNYLGKNTITEGLEIYALKLCQKKKTIVLSDELRAVAILYRSIFIGRIYRSQLEKSIDVGYIIWRMGTTTRSTLVLIKFLPLLFINVIKRKLVHEAVAILQELEFYAMEDTDNSGKLHFYGLCIILQLETGYSLESFRRCEKFFRTEGFNVTLREPDSKQRFFIYLWIWYVRNENWESAKIWQEDAFEFRLSSSEETIPNLFAGLYLLEGQLLYLVGKIDRRNIIEILATYKRIDKLISIFNTCARYAPVVLPRLHHMKAYYKLVKYNNYKAIDDLAKAKNIAKKHGNILEASWIEHSEMAWTYTLSQIAVDFWKDHCDPDNLLDCQEMESEENLGHFTLPIPLYL